MWGVVLNRVKSGSGDGYYYYYGSGSHRDGERTTPQKSDVRAATVLQPGSENGAVRTGSYTKEPETRS